MTTLSKENAKPSPVKELQRLRRNGFDIGLLEQQRVAFIDEKFRNLLNLPRSNDGTNRRAEDFLISPQDQKQYAISDAEAARLGRLFAEGENPAQVLAQDLEAVYSGGSVSGRYFVNSVVNGGSLTEEHRKAV